MRHLLCSPVPFPWTPTTWRPRVPSAPDQERPKGCPGASGVTPHVARTLKTNSELAPENWPFFCPKMKGSISQPSIFRGFCC